MAFAFFLVLVGLRDDLRLLFPSAASIMSSSSVPNPTSCISCNGMSSSTMDGLLGLAKQTVKEVRTARRGCHEIEELFKSSSSGRCQDKVKRTNNSQLSAQEHANSIQ